MATLSSVTSFVEGDPLTPTFLNSKLNPLVANIGAVNAAVTQSYYNVKSYGAVGDGVATDTTAVQAAITAAGAAGGVVFFPVGHYKITATLVLPDVAANQKNNIVLLGSGAPDVVYDGNPTPPELGGSVITFTPTDGTHALSFLPSGAASGLTAITIRDLQLNGPGALSGDGVHLVGDVTNSRVVRVSFQDVAVRNFAGGSGVYLSFCENGSSINLTVNRNKYGLNITGASNANTWVNVVAQYNTTNAIILTGVVTNTFFGGLIQANPKNGVYLNGADECGFYGIHFESNNTTAPNTYYAIHVQGTTGLYNAHITVQGCRFAANTDDLRLEGVVGGTVNYVTIVASRSMATNSMTIADAYVNNTVFVTELGGTITDSGTGTLHLSAMNIVTANSYYHFGATAANPADATASLYNQAGFGPTISGGSVVVRTGNPPTNVTLFDSGGTFSAPAGLDYKTTVNRNSLQILGAQGAAVADATDAASTMARLNDLLARVRAHGLIAT